MSLQTDIKAKMIEAMKAKDALRVSVLRGLSAAFTNELVAKKMPPDGQLSDEDAMMVIAREARKRKDAIEQFEKGGRPELAEDEKAELSILETFLPAQMSEDEIVAYVTNKKGELNPTPETKNQFMGSIMKDLKGKADGNIVKKAVDALFA